MGAISFAWSRLGIAPLEFVDFAKDAGVCRKLRGVLPPRVFFKKEFHAVSKQYIVVRS